ncbi:MAG: hypothetical protein AAF492_09420 [Verrucomicrobiota bacterium]
MNAVQKNKTIFLSLLIGWAGMVSMARAVPHLINYQGRVAVNGINVNTIGQFKFAIVNGTGNTTYWSHDGTSVSGSEPGTFVFLPVINGQFSYQLGSGSEALDPLVFVNDDTRLRVWFSDGSGFEQLTPDQRITSAGYALVAERLAGGIDDADADPSNEANISMALNGTVLELTDGDGTLSVDLAGLASDDADNDPINELNSSLNIIGDVLRLTDGGGTLTADLSGIGDTDWAEIDGNLVRMSGLVGIGDPTPNATLDVEGTAVITESLSVDGDTLVVNHILNRVGIGDPTPEQALDVEGSIEVSQDYTYGAARTFYYNIAPSQFNVENDSEDYDLSSSGGYMVPEQSDWHAMAPIHLPDGARALDITQYYYVNATNPVAFVRLELWRRANLAVNAEEIASTVVSNIPLANAVADSTVAVGTGAVIDNENYQYYLHSHFNKAGSDSAIRFYGARIRYELSTLKP